MSTGIHKGSFQMVLRRGPQINEEFNRILQQQVRGVKTIDIEEIKGEINRTLHSDRAHERTMPAHSSHIN
jgi:hypothetical protein